MWGSFGPAVLGCLVLYPVLFLENQRGSAAMANSPLLSSLVRVLARVQFCHHFFLEVEPSMTAVGLAARRVKLKPPPVASVEGGFYCSTKK